jgi:hypothetical protein
MICLSLPLPLCRSLTLSLPLALTYIYIYTCIPSYGYTFRPLTLLHIARRIFFFLSYSFHLFYAYIFATTAHFFFLFFSFFCRDAHHFKFLILYSTIIIISSYITFSLFGACINFKVFILHDPYLRLKLIVFNM